MQKIDIFLLANMNSYIFFKIFIEVYQYKICNTYIKASKSLGYILVNFYKVPNQDSDSSQDPRAFIISLPIIKSHKIAPSWYLSPYISLAYFKILNTETFPYVSFLPF